MKKNKKQKECPTCKIVFIPQNYHHVFCSPKCYKAHIKQKNKQSNNTLFICPKCKQKIELKFSPKQNKTKWTKFKCPYCKYNPIKETTEIKSKINIIKRLFF